MIIGLHEPFGPNGETEDDNRLGLTTRNRSSFGLSVRRHTGPSEKTPFTGTLDELGDVIWSLMQHIVAPCLQNVPLLMGRSTSVDNGQYGQ